MDCLRNGLQLLPMGCFSVLKMQSQALRGHRRLQESLSPPPTPSPVFLNFSDDDLQVLPTPATQPSPAPSPAVTAETPAPTLAVTAETPAPSPAETVATPAPAPPEETPAPTAALTPAPSIEDTPAPSFAETPAPTPAGETPAPSLGTETPAPSPEARETQAPVATEVTPAPAPAKLTARPTVWSTPAPTASSVVRTSAASISGQVSFVTESVTDTCQLRSAIATFFGADAARVATLLVSSAGDKSNGNVRSRRLRRRNVSTPSTAGSASAAAASSGQVVAAGSGLAAAETGASWRQRRWLADDGVQVNLAFTFTAGFAGDRALLQAAAATDRLALPDAWVTLGSALGIGGGNVTLSRLMLGAGGHSAFYSSAAQDFFGAASPGNGKAITVDFGGGGGYSYSTGEINRGNNGVTAAARGGLVAALVLLCFATFACVFWPVGEVWLARQRRSRAKTRAVLRALGWGPDGLPLPPPVKPGLLDRARQESTPAADLLTPAASVGYSFLSQHLASATAEASPREEVSPIIAATTKTSGKVGAASAAELAAALAAAAAATAAVEAAQAIAAAESLDSVRRQSLERSGDQGRRDSFVFVSGNNGRVARGIHSGDGATGVEARDPDTATRRAAALKYPSIGSTSSFGDSVNMAWRYNSSYRSAAEFSEPHSPAAAGGGATVAAATAATISGTAVMGAEAVAALSYTSAQKNHLSQQKATPRDDQEAKEEAAVSGVTAVSAFAAGEASESESRSSRWAFSSRIARQRKPVAGQSNVARHKAAASAGAASDWKRRYTLGGSGVEACDVPVQSRRPSNYLVGAGAWRSEGYLGSEYSDSDSENDEENVRKIDASARDGPRVSAAHAAAVAAAAGPIRYVARGASSAYSSGGGDTDLAQAAVAPPPAAAVASFVPLRPLPHGVASDRPASMAAAPPLLYRSSSAVQLGTRPARQKASMPTRGQAGGPAARAFATAVPATAGSRTSEPEVERSIGEQTLQWTRSFPMGGRFCTAEYLSAQATPLLPQQPANPCGSFVNTGGSIAYRAAPSQQQEKTQTKPRQQPVRQPEPRQLSPQEQLHQLQKPPPLQQTLPQPVTAAQGLWPLAAPRPRGLPSSVASVRSSVKLGTPASRSGGTGGGGSSARNGGGNGGSGTKNGGGGVAIGGILAAGGGSVDTGGGTCKSNGGGYTSSNSIGYAGGLRFSTTGGGGYGGVASGSLKCATASGGGGIVVTGDSGGGGVAGSGAGGIAGGSAGGRGTIGGGNVKGGSVTGCVVGRDVGGHGRRSSIAGGGMAGSGTVGSIGGSSVAGGGGGGGHLRGSSVASSSSGGAHAFPRFTGATAVAAAVRGSSDACDGSGGTNAVAPLPIGRPAAVVSPLPEMISPMSDDMAEFNHGDMTIRFVSGPPSVKKLADTPSPAISLDGDAESLAANSVQQSRQRAVSMPDNGSEISDAERAVAAQAWSPSPSGNSDLTSVGGLSRLSSVMGSAPGSAESEGVWERPWMQERALDAGK